MPELISPAEYSRRRGVSKEAVSKAIEKGRISTVIGANGRKMIDPVVADIQWAKNTDPDQSARANAPKGNSSPPSGGGGSDGDASGYWDARTRRETAEASMAEMKLKQLAGDLVDRKRVEAAGASAGRMLRDAILGVPTKLAPELSSVTDSWEIERRLTTALRLVLEDAARTGAADLDKAMQP